MPAEGTVVKRGSKVQGLSLDVIRRQKAERQRSSEEEEEEGSCWMIMFIMLFYSVFFNPCCCSYAHGSHFYKWLKCVLCKMLCCLFYLFFFFFLATASWFNPKKSEKIIKQLTQRAFHMVALLHTWFLVFVLVFNTLQWHCSKHAKVSANTLYS